MKFVRIILGVLILTSFASLKLHASQASAYLCETGLELYKQGHYEEALNEFKKALLAEPNYAPALKYIRIIEQSGSVINSQAPAAAYTPSNLNSAGDVYSPASRQTLDLIELQKEMVKDRGPLPGVPAYMSAAEPGPTYKEAEMLGVVPVPADKPRKQMLPPVVINLDESLNKIVQPISIDQGRSLILLGSNIRRYLLTYPEALTVAQTSANELTLTGDQYGYTYVHVWDDSGRRTIEFMTVPPAPEGPSHEEAQRIAGERTGTFKLRYSLDWATYEAGPRLYNLDRTSYNWTHNFGATGPTPYGDSDFALTVRKDQATKADVTYLTIGLTNGKVGPFEGFTLRGFDFWPDFNNMAFPSSTLRGAMLSSPAFDKKLNYTVFWGSEGGGRYGDLSPTLNKVKDSFVSGAYLNVSPTEKQNYNVTITHGWGTDRDPQLDPYVYDIAANWTLNKSLGLSYEAAYDNSNPAQLLNLTFTRPKFSFTAQTRDISKDFNSITGQAWQAGNLGELMTFNYTPNDIFSTNATLDIYRDRLYPAEDNRYRPNEDLNWQLDYRPFKNTQFGLAYILQNDLGKVSQTRYQSPSLSASTSFHAIADMSAYFSFAHQDNTVYTSPASDYKNERLYSGLRINLIGALYMYYNNEINYLHEEFNDNHVMPNANEIGLDWSDQLWNTPFYGTMRFTYRDEEDAVSDLSFLSGQDYIEGNLGLSYRPTDNNELYASCRIRNNWKDGVNNAQKGFDVDFNAGMRYLWDTGLRWDAVCNISGYVFKDTNGDGLRQRDEAPVEGMKVWLGKDRSLLTDIFGYYQFRGVRGQKAYTSLDGSLLPPGYVPTVPIRQEVAISQGKNIRVDFGIISRCEITGFVFEDADGNGQYNKGDQGIAGVLMSLENGLKSVTDSTGHYRFLAASPGDHTVTLDLKSLPIQYLPETAISKKITIFEGVAYTYNIPLKKIKKQ